MAQKLDWAIIPNKAGIKSVLPQEFHYYDLYNVTVAEALCYGERTWGINLRWCDPAKSDNIRFQKKTGDKNPITFEDPIAIHVRGGGWLVYQSGRRGINLGWSDTPKFEWQFMGGKTNEQVKPGTTVELYNQVEKDYLMYEARDWGINLKWSKDAGKYNTISDAVRVAKEVGPVVIAIGKLIGGSG